MLPGAGKITTFGQSNTRPRASERERECKGHSANISVIPIQKVHRSEIPQTQKVDTRQSRARTRYEQCIYYYCMLHMMRPHAHTHNSSQQTHTHICADTPKKITYFINSLRYLNDVHSASARTSRKSVLYANLCHSCGARAFFSLSSWLGGNHAFSVFPPLFAYSIGITSWTARPESGISAM